MTIKKTLPVIIAVTSLIISLSVLFINTKSDTSFESYNASAEQKDINRILNCIPKSISDGINKCLSDEMVKISLVRGPNQVMNLIVKASETNPRVLIDCHNSGHDMGRALYKEIKDLKKLIPLYTPVCGGSYIHGVFDAWEMEKPSLNDFTIAAKECNKLDITSHSPCYDGLAHILWRVYPSEKSLAEICSIGITGQARTGCFGGVLMQKYAPAIGEATNDIKLALKEIPNFCANLPEWKPLPIAEGFGSNDNPNINAACFDSASYVFRVYNLDKPEITFTTEIDDTPIQSTKAIEGYLTSCQSMLNITTEADKNAISGCKSRIGGLIFMRDPLNYKEISNKVCTSYLKEPELQKCTEHIQELEKGK